MILFTDDLMHIILTRFECQPRLFISTRTKMKKYRQSDVYSRFF